MAYEIEFTEMYQDWFESLKDTVAKTKILVRLARIENGNFGITKQLAPQLFELKFTIGPGYRVYYTIRDEIVVLLLVGGDKSSQTKDIIRAKDILKEV